MDSKARGWTTALALLVSVFMAGVLSAAAIMQLRTPTVEAPDRDQRRRGPPEGRSGRPGGAPRPDGRFGGGPAGDQDFFLDMLTERLELDVAQRTQVGEILANRAGIADQVMHAMRDQLRSVMDSLDTELRDVLTEDQQEAFDLIQREGRDRLGRRFHGGGGPPDRGRRPPR